MHTPTSGFALNASNGCLFNPCAKLPKQKKTVPTFCVLFAVRFSFCLPCLGLRGEPSAWDSVESQVLIDHRADGTEKKKSPSVVMPRLSSSPRGHQPGLEWRLSLCDAPSRPGEAVGGSPLLLLATFGPLFTTTVSQHFNDRVGTAGRG